MPGGIEPTHKDGPWAAWDHFVATTTMAGVAQCVAGPYTWVKVIWTLLFATMAGGTAYTTYNVVAVYLTYPVATTNTITHEESLAFPTVTVCNRNPIPCDKMAIGYVKYKEDLGKLMDYSYCWETAWKPPLINMILGAGDPAVAAWKSNWTAKLEQIVQAGNWSALGVADPEECMEELSLNATADFTMNDTYYKILVEDPDCAANLGSILFPEFRAATYPQEEWQDSSPDDKGRNKTGADQGIQFHKAPRSFTESQVFLSEYTSLFINKSRRHIFKELVVPLETFVANCYFQGSSCRYRSYFTEEIVPQFGTCYTFNNYFTTTDPYGGNRSSFLTGKMYGLTLDLMLNQETYMPSVAASGAGGRVTLVRPGVRANPVEDGYFFAPHTETDIAIHMTVVTRQPDPYTSQCWDSWSTQAVYTPVIDNSARGDPPRNITIYTGEECHELCEANLLATHCKCVYPYYATPFYYKGVDVTAGLRVCDLTGVDSLCYAAFLAAMQKNASFVCPCNLPCETMKYSSSISTSTWPSDAYLDKVADKYLGKLAVGQAEDFTQQDVRKQRVQAEFAKVNIFFETMNVDRMTEAPVYDYYGIMGSAGGSLSLFLGICGATVFEIAQLVVMTVLSLLGYVHGKNHIRNRTLPTEICDKSAVPATAKVDMTCKRIPFNAFEDLKAN